MLEGMRVSGIGENGEFLSEFEVDSIGFLGDFEGVGELVGNLVCCEMGELRTCVRFYAFF